MTAQPNGPHAAPFARLLWSVPLSVLLHNLEEYPRIVTFAQRHGVPIKRRPMGLAVALATLLPWIITAVAARRPTTSMPLRLTLAMPSLMAVNALIHLAQTILLRDYSPGTVTGVVINLPLAGYLYQWAAREGLLPPRELRRVAMVGTASMVPLALVLQALGWMLDRCIPARTT
jgi:hypothetical protein